MFWIVLGIAIVAIIGALGIMVATHRKYRRMTPEERKAYDDEATREGRIW